MKRSRNRLQAESGESERGRKSEVRRFDVDGNAGAEAALERLHRELTMVCTGPWPPYSFADAREDA